MDGVEGGEGAGWGGVGVEGAGEAIWAGHFLEIGLWCCFVRFRRKCGSWG